jgi:hypothetical protein
MKYGIWNLEDNHASKLFRQRLGAPQKYHASPEIVKTEAVCSRNGRAQSKKGEPRAARLSSTFLLQRQNI